MMTQDAESGRLSAVDAAIAFASKLVPDLSALFLAGSVVRDDAGSLSDLDLVVLAEDAEIGWSSHEEFGWPIELFLQTPESIRVAFEKERRNRWPLLLSMCGEARLVFDPSGVGAEVQAAARMALAHGPEPWSEGEIDWYRYNLTWMIDDVVDGNDIGELGFMVNDLVVTSIETVLYRHRAWLGKGKWLIRNLRLVDVAAAERIVEAQRSFAVAGEREPLVAFARQQLDAIGGRKFGGLSGNW